METWQQVGDEGGFGARVGRGGGIGGVAGKVQDALAYLGGVVARDGRADFAQGLADGQGEEGFRLGHRFAMARRQAAVDRLPDSVGGGVVAQRLDQTGEELLRRHVRGGRGGFDQGAPELADQINRQIGDLRVHAGGDTARQPGLRGELAKRDAQAVIGDQHAGRMAQRRAPAFLAAAVGGFTLPLPLQSGLGVGVHVRFMF